METVRMVPEGIKYIVIHSSNTKPSEKVTRKTLEKRHRQKGYFGIGYHYVIRRDGKVEDGRPLHQPGNHVFGYNQISWGICLAGGCDEKTGVPTGKWDPEENFTLDQLHALYILVSELQKYARNASVVGHRDLIKKTACPHFDVKAWLASLHSSN